MSTPDVEVIWAVVVDDGAEPPRLVRLYDNPEAAGEHEAFVQSGHGVRVEAWAVYSEFVAPR